MGFSTYWWLFPLMCISYVVAVNNNGQPTMFGLCERFRRRPFLQFGQQTGTCVNERDGYVYCRIARCPIMGCDAPILNRSDNCEICPGFCQNGGRIFPLGRPFRSIDGVNTCRCVRSNSFDCRPNIRPTVRSLCFPQQNTY